MMAVIDLSFWTELLEVLKSIWLMLQTSFSGIVQLIGFVFNVQNLSQSMSVALPSTVGLVITVAIVVGVANVLIRGFGSNG